MAPPIEAWPASQLPARVQVTAKGRRRKQPIELERCELLEMIQYNCRVDQREGRTAGRILCVPVERLFRRCRDGVIVETTALEGNDARQQIL